MRIRATRLWNGLRHSSNIFLVSIAQTIGFGVLVILSTILFVNFLTTEHLKTEQNQQRINLVRLISLVQNSIEPYRSEVSAGKITPAEGVALIQARLRHMTFTDETGQNYIFMGTYAGELLVQPYRPELVGTNQWDLQDENGVYIIREIVQSALNAPQGGFLTYVYPAPGTNDLQEKMSYVIGIPELQVFIGTGLYLDRYVLQQVAYLKTARAFMVIFIFVTVLVSVVTISGLNSQSNALKTEVETRKQAQQTLELAEQNLRGVFNGVYDAIIIHDRQGKIIEVNNRFLEMTGLKHEQALRTEVFDFFPQDIKVQARINLAWERVHRAGELIQEFTVTSPVSREKMEVEAGLRPISWYGQDAIISIVRDTTARKKIENALAVSEARFRAAVDNIPFDLLIFDSKTQEIIFQNESALRNQDLYPQRQFAAPFNENWQKIKAEITGHRIYQEEITIPAGDSLKEIYRVVAPVFDRGELDQIISINMDISDRKLAEKKILYTLEKLDGLHQIDMQIIARKSLQKVFDTVLDQIVNILHGDAVNMLALDPHTQQLTRIAHYGIDSKTAHCGPDIQKDCQPWQIVQSGKPVFTTAKDVGIKICRFFQECSFKSFYAMPILSNGSLKGVIEVYLRGDQERDQEWINYLETLAGQAAIAIDYAALIHDLERSYTELNEAYEETIRGWSKALELRDEETQGHSERVMNLSTELAGVLGFEGEIMENFRRGVLLHDIGKMGIPDNILLKPGALNPDEWGIMKKHPEMAYRLLSNILYLKPSLEIPYCHHERWDGSGYPQGLAGAEIPLSARIFAVVDVWDALISDRPYRKGWQPAEAAAYLQTNAGAQFDPEVVRAFLELPPVIQARCSPLPPG